MSFFKKIIEKATFTQTQKITLFRAHVPVAINRWLEYLEKEGHLDNDLKIKGKPISFFNTDNYGFDFFWQTKGDPRFNRLPFINALKTQIEAIKNMGVDLKKNGNQWMFAVNVNPRNQDKAQELWKNLSQLDNDSDDLKIKWSERTSSALMAQCNRKIEESFKPIMDLMNLKEEEIEHLKARVERQKTGFVLAMNDPYQRALEKEAPQTWLKLQEEINNIEELKSILANENLFNADLVIEGFELNLHDTFKMRPKIKDPVVWKSKDPMLLVLAEKSWDLDEGVNLIRERIRSKSEKMINETVNQKESFRGPTKI